MSNINHCEPVYNTFITEKDRINKEDTIVIVYKKVDDNGKTIFLDQQLASVVNIEPHPEYPDLVIGKAEYYV